MKVSIKTNTVKNPIKTGRGFVATEWDVEIETGHHYKQDGGLNWDPVPGEKVREVFYSVQGVVDALRLFEKTGKLINEEV